MKNQEFKKIARIASAVAVTNLYDSFYIKSEISSDIIDITLFFKEDDEYVDVDYIEININDDFEISMEDMKRFKSVIKQYI